MLARLVIVDIELSPSLLALSLFPRWRAPQVMIDIELLGFVHHWGLEVNGINVIGEWDGCLSPDDLQTLLCCFCVLVRRWLGMFPWFGAGPPMIRPSLIKMAFSCNRCVIC